MANNRGSRRIVTLRDVAERAGVSVSTASRVLSGTEYASEDAIRRVKEAVQSLDYRPNESARALRRARTMTFGVVYHQLRNPTVLDSLEGVETGADERGYSVLVASARDSMDRYVALIQRLMERRVDAILLSNLTDAARDEVDLVRSSGIPVVVMAARMEGVSHVPMVAAPWRNRIFDMVRDLAALGHDSIAFVGAIRGSQSPLPSLSEAAAQYGIRRVDEPAQDYGEAAAMQALDALLARRDRPSALVVLNRNLSATLARLGDRGFRVPEDISVVNINDSSSRATTGLVAEIHVDQFQVGYQAAMTAADWLEGTEPENRLELDIAEWLPATSLGPAPARLNQQSGDLTARMS
ncbi:MAG: LacI family DNA-binding transcriptional regulator [Dehalococcoidia bacterium]|nr:LacI family DNA-binding transcriptional regulator [Dehalococcoidia bacterium]MCA9856008.1 LacI family DNA-binding transcriptional regulator [Dehalococcoidia bacterium]MCB9483721.1 LacI family DNA-binding transcriptional regulator [Dehalococcoidia bacterium]